MGVGGGDPTPGAASDLPAATGEPGARCGRYVLFERLGAGGMGVVYAAYDPSLDRKVALKLLRHGEGADEGAIERNRLLREAKALARLSHPNVVHVYDVGTVGDDQVFIAMELVEGVTLRAWMREKKQRPWREVLPICLQAGEGLAAAHRADLVHRDFKPENVLLGKDGRVLVFDFGLAVPPDAESPAAADAAARIAAARIAAARDAPPPPAGAGVHTLERYTVGAIGTPAYMAPEQHEGKPTDARTDQYSYCLTLYEALYGKRPFRTALPTATPLVATVTNDGDEEPGETMLDLGALKRAGEIPPPPADTDVPAWLRRAVVRGLARTPGERFPTMDALLA